MTSPAALAHPALVRSRTGVMIADGLTGIALIVAVVLLGPLIGTGDAPIAPGGQAALVLAAVIMAVAMAVRRLLPGWALALAWASTLVHMLGGLDAGLTQLGILVVLASAAHYGSTGVLRLSGFSLPVGALLALAYLVSIDSWLVRLFASTAFSPSWLPFAVLAALIALMLAVPWLIGLLARTMRLGREGRERAAHAEALARRADELAALQAERTMLARDVHDIVGHSLAVIVAQAESVRFRDADDLAAVRDAVTTIADTARRALGDVRGVLESTSSPGAVDDSPGADLARLIADVAASRPGMVVDGDTSVAALAGVSGVAAYRATQELLTNALRHGDATEPLHVTVERADGVIVVTVENGIPIATEAGSGAGALRVGTGLQGARARLEAVGGTLEEHHVDGRFRAIVRVPAGEGPS